jgi:hypothetical protein
MCREIDSPHLFASERTRSHGRLPQRLVGTLCALAPRQLRGFGPF